MQTCFSEFQGKSILKCPKFETRCLAHASRIKAPATFALDVHRGAFAQQQLRSRDVTFLRCRVQRREASGGFFPETPSGRCGLRVVWWRRGRCAADDERKLWAAELYIRSTDKGTMNILDSTASNCAKQNIFTHIYKHIEQHRTSFMAFCFQQITFNETLSIISLIVCLPKLKRLWKTMPIQCHQGSQIVNNMTWNQVQNISWARPVQSTTNDIVLVLTQSNCAKQKNIHKHIEQVSIHLVSDKLPSMKQSLWYYSFCSQIEKAFKSNVIKKVK